MAGHSKPLTPLRYPGGKGAFAPFVKSIIKTNHLQGGHYMEPFAGGAGVALDLLFNGYVSDIHINDVDLAIYHFWRAIVNNTDNFLTLLQQAPLTIREWEKQKLILKHPKNHSDLERVHSLRSRTPKKAKATICRLVLTLRSQFFQSRLFFSNQEKLRSTTHRFGNTAKRCNSFRLAISTSAPINSCTDEANA